MTFSMVGEFHDDLVNAHEAVGYDLVGLPMSTVANRAAFVASYVNDALALGVVESGP